MGSYHTVAITVQYLPVPVTGMVFMGTGTVSNFLTCGIPVPNPNDDQLERSVSVDSKQSITISTTCLISQSRAHSQQEPLEY